MNAERSLLSRPCVKKLSFERTTMRRQRSMMMRLGILVIATVVEI